jgi:hypothetical protein
VIAKLLIGYFAVGLLMALLGALLRSRARRTTFLEQLVEAWPLWLLTVFVWPLGIDIALLHDPVRCAKCGAPPWMSCKECYR